MDHSEGQETTRKIRPQGFGARIAQVALALAFMAVLLPAAGAGAEHQERLTSPSKEVGADLVPLNVTAPFHLPGVGWVVRFDVANRGAGPVGHTFYVSIRSTAGVWHNAIAVDGVEARNFIRLEVPVANCAFTGAVVLDVFNGVIETNDQNNIAAIPTAICSK